MIWVRVKLLAIALAILCLASYVVFLEVQASDDSDEQISSSTVWNPSADDLKRIQQNCAAQTDNYSRCFIEQMPNFGASDDAVSFTRTYAEQNHGLIAFLKGFRPVDVVDVGYAYFPGGADFAQRWLLLNGIPEVIDVDDFKLLPQAEMMKDPVYAALRKRYPQITLFDGDRGFETPPAADSLPDGGQWFLIDYPLKDQCRACAEVGSASFRFDFEPTGRFKGAKFVKVTPAPQMTR
ncbi:MAG TPA: hypothetical protein VI488_04215 [Candidatus Angelobacter sp.]